MNLTERYNLACSAVKFSYKELMKNFPEIVSISPEYLLDENEIPVDIVITISVTSLITLPTKLPIPNSSEFIPVRIEISGKIIVN